MPQVWCAVNNKEAGDSPMMREVEIEKKIGQVRDNEEALCERFHGTNYADAIILALEWVLGAEETDPADME
jgi:hypothetical protein